MPGRRLSHRSSMNTQTKTQPQHPAQTFSAGDMLVEMLVTDSVGWEVVATTAQTLTIRRTKTGKIVQSDNLEGNPYPLVWEEMVPNPDAQQHVVRRRGDGTFRVDRGARPLFAAPVIDGIPVTRTDHRF